MSSMSDYALGFMPPSWHLAQAKQEREYFERVLVKQAVPWVEDIKFNPQLVIDGTTFQPQRLFDYPAQAKFHYHADPTKTLGYSNHTLPRGSALSLYQGQKRGRVRFTTDVVIPTIYNLEKKEDGHPKVWMSYTPAEVLTCRQGIRLAKGTVLLGGLGIGYMLRAIAAKKSVQKIILVENSQALLDWYGDRLVEEIRHISGKPIEVIVDDALAHIGQHGAEVRHIIDIWDSFPAYYSREWEAAAKTVRYFWGWGWVEYP